MQELQEMQKLLCAWSVQAGVDLPTHGRPAGAFRLLCLFAQPSGLGQAVEQVLGLVGIETVAQRIATNVLHRYLGLVVALDPAQHFSSVGVALAQADLAE